MTVCSPASKRARQRIAHFAADQFTAKRSCLIRACVRGLRQSESSRTRRTIRVLSNDLFVRQLSTDASTPYMANLVPATSIWPSWSIVSCFSSCCICLRGLFVALVSPLRETINPTSVLQVGGTLCRDAIEGIMRGAEEAKDSCKLTSICPLCSATDQAAEHQSRNITVELETRTTDITKPLDLNSPPHELPLFSIALYRTHRTHHKPASYQMHEPSVVSPTIRLLRSIRNSQNSQNQSTSERIIARDWEGWGLRSRGLFSQPGNNNINTTTSHIISTSTPSSLDTLTGSDTRIRHRTSPALFNIPSLCYQRRSGFLASPLWPPPIVVPALLTLPRNTPAPVPAVPTVTATALNRLPILPVAPFHVNEQAVRSLSRPRIPSLP